MPMGSGIACTGSAPPSTPPCSARAAIVTQYRIEWFNNSFPGETLYAKNHMVANVVFTKRFQAVAK
ncbi:hypothetical protein Dda_1855 [Drechslerella dactyloides]|uniref:Uncharacterized protein n=1 Tax=Drechslerella dactyloides TaxID=74499 RepID=A0AAD6J2G0_DREDA|nr:hypothetical protein Dda_1855 [Drechslerella dactyloides]